MRAAIIAALVALTLLLAGLAAAPWFGEPPGAPPRPAVAAAAPAFPAPPKPEPPTDYAPFIERPLFSAARRPPPPEAPGEPVEDPMAGYLFNRYEIAGVLSMNGATTAMLRDMRDGGLLRIRAGDRLDEAEVLDITLESLTFRVGAATVVAPIEREDPAQR